MLVLKKKYDLLNKEFLNLNNKNEKFKEEIAIKELLIKENENSIKKLKDENAGLFLDVKQFENEIDILNQEIKLYEDTVKYLEEENEKLKKTNMKLIDLWNLTNKKLWTNKESVRQLRNLSREIREARTVNKSYLANYLNEISMYINQGTDIELRTIDKLKGENENENN